jgi:hypothetical protein
MTELAQRSTVQIGAIAVEGFMLADGSYRMSQTQAAECVGKPQRNAGRFLESKGIKALRGEGYTPDTIEVESSDQGRGQPRFNALPLDVVSAYWLWESSKGNQQALMLCYALMTETLERRFDDAFGVERSQAERDERLTRSMEQMESYLKDATDFEAEARFETQYYRDLIIQLGYDPDNPPSFDEPDG